MISFFRTLYLILAILFFTSVNALETEWSNGDESQLRLITKSSNNDNKAEIFLGLEYKLKDGWKTYWKSPGDGGFPQTIDWTESSNIKSLEIYWPTPEYFEILGINSIGYKDNIIFPLKIILEDPSQPTSLVTNINYLVCKDICIPGKANLNLNIPNGLGTLTKHAFSIEKAISRLPIKNLEISFLKNFASNSYYDGKFISIEISAEANKIFKSPEIFINTKYGLPIVDPETHLSVDSKTLKSKFIFEKELIQDKKFYAEIIIKDGSNSFLKKNLLQSENLNLVFVQSSFIIFIIAFVGGLILNGMPCVLPILSIKILSILQNIQNPLLVRKSFLITSFGIITSFLSLAIIFIFLRYLGVSVGWGIQFQEPYFLLFIALILVLFSLNLFGFFEISLPKFLNTKFITNLHSENYFKDFFTGFFATLMATPCSAPFVGTALTAAFTQSPIMMILIFFSMSIGMASPYLFFSLFPSFVNYFPKPGKWMLYLRYFLGLLLLATLIWIINIILNHFNIYLILVSLFILIFILFLNNFLKIKSYMFIVPILIFLVYLILISSIQIMYFKIGVGLILIQSIFRILLIKITLYLLMLLLNGVLHVNSIK